MELKKRTRNSKNSNFHFFKKNSELFDVELVE